MIIPALVRLYDNLAASDDSGVAPKGYSEQKISFEVVLNKNGTLHDIQPVSITVTREFTKKVKGESVTQTKSEEKPKPVLVPGQSKPSGSGINPCFLWDNAVYMLGFKPEDPKPERTRESFKAFRDKHAALAPEIKDPGFKAVCTFLDEWNPAQAKSYKNTAGQKLEDFAGGFGVFRLRADTEYIHQREAVRAWWEESLEPDGEEGEQESGERVPSLVDGRLQPIARLHEPRVKGVMGAQSSGAAIVSFNQRSFESYGKDQGSNAPVGVDDAFKYCTALNRLTGDDKHRVRIGGDTYVFWSEGRRSAVEDFFAGLFDDRSSSKEMSHDDLREILRRVRQGLPVKEFGEPSTPFYVLGLSPNMSRLSVRMWLVSSVGEMVKIVQRHLQSASIGQRFPHFQTAPGNKSHLSFPLQREDDLSLNSPSLVRLAASLARVDKDDKPAYDDIDARLAAAISRAILTGNVYPQSMFDTVLSRIEHDGHFDYARAALIKAFLTRNRGISMDTHLNKVHPRPEYHCGRLLAVVGYSQRESIGEVNSGIVRRNLGAALASPGLTIPRLMETAEKAYFPKIDGNKGDFVRDEARLIHAQLGDCFPRTLDSYEKGTFLLGYFQEDLWLDSTVGALSRYRYRTKRGEWVRSKGELWVADCLLRMGLPYVYEPRALLSHGQERWPDFVIPAADPKDEIYVEYLGMTDNSAYDKRWNEKLDEYRRVGITVEGGPNGTLVVLDARKQKLDELDIRRKLRAFDPGLISEDSANEKEI